MKNTLRYFLMLVVFCSLGIIVWGFDKAFDLTDAGFYLLRYQPQQPVDYGGILYDYILIKAIFPAALLQIIPMRVIGFLLNLLSTVLFSYAIFSYVKRKKKTVNLDFVTVFFFAFAGFVFSYAGTPGELSYNTLNQFFIITGAAFICLSLVAKSPAKYVFCALAGSLYSLIFLLKIPSGLAAVLSGGLILLLTGERKLISVLSFGVGASLTLLSIYMLIKPDFITYYTHGYLALSKNTEYNYSLVSESLNQILQVNRSAFLKALGINAILFVADRITDLKWRLPVYALCAYAIIISFSQGFVLHYFGAMMMSGFVMLWVYLILLRSIVVRISGYYTTVERTNPIGENAFLNSESKRVWSLLKTLAGRIKNNYDYLAFIAFILILPYVGALGTINSLNWGAKFYYTATFGALTYYMGYFASP